MPWRFPEVGAVGDNQMPRTCGIPVFPVHTVAPAPKSAKDTNDSLEEKASCRHRSLIVQSYRTVRWQPWLSSSGAFGVRRKPD